MIKITYICDICEKVISERVGYSLVESDRVDILTNRHRSTVNLCEDCFTRRLGDLFPDSDRIDTEIIDE